MNGLELFALQVASLKSQIGAMQAQLMAMELAISNMQANASADDQAVCLHPHVTNHGTFGAPELRCEDCGAVVPA